ncbi:cyclase [Paludibacter jiangxiensis]|uniref:Cyclase n=2 Tax=Paludibacter jiangxiensis TaxID=681398 RepID=A0A161L9G2_9BACT|nr:cyclase [Paludibacter jiangxiensis]
MYYNALPSIFAKAKELRENMTQAEMMLWEKLRRNQLGVRFKPQHPIDIFIADFYCHPAKLVIEVDGQVHASQTDYDDGRTAELERLGITVIRFRNEEVFDDIDKVIRKIKQKLYELDRQ